MLRKLVMVCLLLLVVPTFLWAQDGKLRGRVTDKETGEPLIGVNVIIEGTTLGAATDANGDYIVLGIPPGVYSVRVSYIGYQTLVVSNIRINANMTTTRDFQLQSTALEVEALEIVAERPIVQRNTTNTVRMTTQEDIEHIPIRGLQNIIALNAGTVQQDGVLHVRGGRAGEIAYFVDGATATNPLFNSENISVIQEAIEEIQLQAGGYTAEFGGANSAVVRTTVRTGGAKFKATVDYRTDDFAKSGQTFLGTHSYGYRNGVVTLSGPMPMFDKLRYFVAYQFNGMRDRNPQLHHAIPFLRFDRRRIRRTGRWRFPAGRCGISGKSSAQQLVSQSYHSGNDGV
ncbi:MAG: carboxypeptidase regulatory-like domain-containing protein [candidate division KSB1 bacterium]|nr:carboxypeptidase regulatory-like domain-containing protein [candidate division KSB1 bacterium]